MTEKPIKPEQMISDEITNRDLVRLFSGCKLLSEKLDRVKNFSLCVSARNDALAEISCRAETAKQTVNPDVVDVIVNTARLHMDVEAEMMLRAYNEGLYTAIILCEFDRSKIIAAMSKCLSAKVYLELWDEIRMFILELLDKAVEEGEQYIRQEYNSLFSYGEEITPEIRNQTVYYATVPVTDGLEIELLFAATRTKIREAYMAMNRNPVIGEMMQMFIFELNSIADVLTYMIPTESRGYYTIERIAADMHLYIRTNLVVQGFKDLFDSGNENKTYDETMFALVCSMDYFQMCLEKFYTDIYNELIEYDRYRMIEMAYIRMTGELPEDFDRAPDEVQSQLFSVVPYGLYS